jgi:SAM-dependent methyltransferase
MAVRQAEMETPPAAIEEFVHKALGDVASALTASLVVIGDKLGLYKELAKCPATTAELATRTGTTERYVREWLNAQAAAGYVTYDKTSKQYTLPAAQAACLTDEESPACVLGAFQAMTAAMRANGKVGEGFKTGCGVGWHEHDPDLFVGVERFFRPGYNAHLVQEWIPALDGVQKKLERGARVADVGCGLGASTIILAKAFPKSDFVGFDYHGPSIERARERARAAGVGDRVRFEVATAQAFPGANYDLISCFDCLHDMGDPVGAAGTSCSRPMVWPRRALRQRPVEDNLNPARRLFYSVSTPSARRRRYAGGRAPRRASGRGRLRNVLEQAGHSHPPRDADAVQPGARSAAVARR